MMLELAIDGIRVSLMNQQRVVILRVKDTDKYLPIWIGPGEADAIALKLQNVTVPRPLTHDLLSDVIASLHAKVDRIVVSDLSDDTFFAKIVLQVNGSTMEVDSRPSDALVRSQFAPSRQSSPKTLLWRRRRLCWTPRPARQCRTKKMMMIHGHARSPRKSERSYPPSRTLSDPWTSIWSRATHRPRTASVSRITHTPS